MYPGIPHPRGPIGEAPVFSGSREGLWDGEEPGVPPTYPDSGTRYETRSSDQDTLTNRNGVNAPQTQTNAPYGEGVQPGNNPGGCNRQQANNIRMIYPNFECKMRRAHEQMHEQLTTNANTPIEGTPNQNSQIYQEPNRETRRHTTRQKNQEHRNPTLGAHRKRCRKDTKASIKIAGLNIRGHGTLNVTHEENKWLHIRQIMNQRNIGILAVGEAYLNSERRDEIERVHGANIRIFYSSLPDTPNAAGVALVLNRKITNAEGIQTHEVIAGHALLLETHWHSNEKLSILGIYAPNINMQVNAAFWMQIKDFFEQNPHIRKPDLMIGDCNVVEEPMDRLPMRSNKTVAVDALDDLKSFLQLEDGWRNTYPSSMKYTFSRTGNDGIKHHARLDRIYNKTSSGDNLFEWKIETPGIKTDHEMVSVRFNCESAPQIGRGRWILSQNILYDKQLKDG